MKVLYDPAKDVLQVSFNQAIIEETAQIAPGVILDYDEDGKIIGIEVRQASKKTDNPYRLLYTVEEANSNKPPLKGDAYE
ncbi:MAG: DUF2283 domain-containing protein [Phormidesmis sp.]